MTCEHPTMLKAKIAKKNNDIKLDNKLESYCCMSCGELFLVYHISLLDNLEFSQILKKGVKEWKENIPRT